MKSYTPVAVSRNGDFICINCMSEVERAVFADETTSDEIQVIFADTVEPEDICGKCSRPVLEAVI